MFKYLIVLTNVKLYAILALTKLERAKIAFIFERQDIKLANFWASFFDIRGSRTFKKKTIKERQFLTSHLGVEERDK